MISRSDVHEYFSNLQETLEEVGIENFLFVVQTEQPQGNCFDTFTSLKPTEVAAFILAFIKDQPSLRKAVLDKILQDYSDAYNDELCRKVYF